MPHSRSTAIQSERTRRRPFEKCELAEVWLGVVLPQPLCAQKRNELAAGRSQ